MNWLSVLPLVIAMLPGIIQGVEAAADPSTSGADKKKAVLAAVEQAAALAMEVDPKDSALIKICASAVSPVIDFFVMAYNLKGLFSHKKAVVA